jgi:GNAT superfamily N-acetyltransferase
MSIIVEVATVEQLDTVGRHGGIAPLGSREFTLHSPDTHVAVLDSGGMLSGRCSLWWHSVPPCPGERVGLVGHYEVRDGETAAELLAHACGTLIRHGCTLAIGPMDGSTWRRYRFITRRGTEPPFFLEPDNPDDYPGHFLAAGFTPLARYYSNLDPDLGWVLDGAAMLEESLENEGVQFRSLRMAEFAEELERIYQLSVSGFQGNFLYTPIGQSEFHEMYSRLQSFIIPDLVWFAEQGGSPVGFIFAVPDLLRAGPDGPSDTVIFKSMAVLPAWNRKGIGSLFLAKVSEQARRKGFRRSIHALMHEGNRSRLLSGHHGAEIREYTLFSRRLK